MTVLSTAAGSVRGTVLDVDGATVQCFPGIPHALGITRTAPQSPFVWSEDGCLSLTLRTGGAGDPGGMGRPGQAGDGVDQWRSYLPGANSDAMYDGGRLAADISLRPAR